MLFFQLQPLIKQAHQQALNQALPALHHHHHHHHHSQHHRHQQQQQQQQQQQLSKSNLQYNMHEINIALNTEDFLGTTDSTINQKDNLQSSEQINRKEGKLSKNNENTQKTSESINNTNLSSKIHHRHAHTHRAHGHHSQANCLFFVDPCTSLELMVPSSHEKAGQVLSGTVGPPGNVVHLSVSGGISSPSSFFH